VKGNKFWERNHFKTKKASIFVEHKKLLSFVEPEKLSSFIELEKFY
jgi:hypothetical protein